MTFGRKYGAHFIEETPLRDDEQYRFGGWYTGAQGSGEHYTTETTVTEPYLNVYAFWIPNDEHVDNLIINDEHHSGEDCLDEDVLSVPDTGAGLITTKGFAVTAPSVIGIIVAVFLVLVIYRYCVLKS